MQSRMRTVTFDDVKCNVINKGIIIFRGNNDPSNDLWTLPITREGMCANPRPNTNKPAPPFNAGKPPCRMGGLTQLVVVLTQYARNAHMTPLVRVCIQKQLPLLARATSQPGPCYDCVPLSPLDQEKVSVHPGVTLAMFVHSVKSRLNQVKFAHQSLSNNLKISSLFIATRRGFLKGCPNMSEKLILRYLHPSPATAKTKAKGDPFRKRLNTI